MNFNKHSYQINNTFAIIIIYNKIICCKYTYNQLQALASAIELPPSITIVVPVI